jgi:NADH-quinone oxidoreductase subunit F
LNFLRDDPAEDRLGLLPALHEAQARDGCLTRDALEHVAASFRLAVADVFGAASFYHYFNTESETPIARAACQGPVCSLAGFNARAAGTLHRIPCPGLCDRAPARYDSGRFYAAGNTGEDFLLPRMVDNEVALLSGISTPKPEDLERYREAGGYRQLMSLIHAGDSANALALLEASGLLGRGGAAFPLAAKWKAVRAAPQSPKYVICNADEGEPGTFKDRALLHLRPHLLLEGMAIAGHAVGAATGIIYLRYEYPQALAILSQAVLDAEQARLLGDRIQGSSFSFRIMVRRGAGSYVCGEETARWNSLEGRRPWPRERPPFPTTHGLFGKPTVVNNVETLCWAPMILEKGAEWFRGLGKGDNGGTKIYSVSGLVQRPGNYELPLGISARELIFDHAGGPEPGHAIRAFTLGGISGGLLGEDRLDLALDYQSPPQHGVFLGSGGVIVLDERCCVVDFVRSCMVFYEQESCGKCYPCRIGTVRLREWLDALTGRAAQPALSKVQVEEIGAAMTSTSACGLGQSAPLVVKGMQQFFPEEVDAHLRARKCPVGVCPC